MGIHKITMSRFFQPVQYPPHNALEKSPVALQGFKRLINSGYIKLTSRGMYALLPLGLRVINKLANIVHREMSNIGAQQVALPALAPASLWEKTQRYDKTNAELFTLQDRNDTTYILNPTCEELMCELIPAAGSLSPKILPLRLYQISSKWRDEMKPRHSFLRSREFLMKDLYTFDADLKAAEKTYNEICATYDKIFNKIGIKFLKAIGDTGMIGGLLSHEYHFISDIGEDTVVSCSSCHYHANISVHHKPECPQCGNALSKNNTIEVGHSFLLGTKYSKPLSTFYLNVNKNIPLEMGCYGLGISRIMIAAAEILSCDKKIRWPKVLAPFTVCIIPPRTGTKADSVSHYADDINKILTRLNIDTIIDDRNDLSIGKRMVHAHLTGFPYVVIIGHSAKELPPVFEIHDVYNSDCKKLTIDALSDYFESISDKEELPEKI